MIDRRTFLTGAAKATSALWLLPTFVSCKPQGNGVPETSSDGVPRAKPLGWDPIAYNKARGMKGAIPSSYHQSILGADGDNKHLGKHLPFVPSLPENVVPDGYMPLMWGDPNKGHARHPNASRGPANNGEGHWYNWIRVARTGPTSSDEVQSEFSDWPLVKTGDDGQYLGLDGKPVDSDGGRNTIYLVKSPNGARKGDTVRIWAHCLTHGEYVDFVTI